MSIHAFHLQGWEELSTWGSDNDLHYAQLTRNGGSDDDGPEIWICPPRYIVRGATELVHVIAAAIGERPELVDEAMSRGLALDRGERIPPATESSPAATSDPSAGLPT